MKKCFKCLRKKSLDKFYKHKGMADGYLNKCKNCTKKDVKRRYGDPTTKKRIIEYERLRYKTPERKAQIMGYQKKMRKKFPGKYRARNLVNNAIRDGKIIKKPCEICREVKVEAHHEDYRKPLKITWLCRKHHLESEGKKSNT